MTDLDLTEASEKLEQLREQQVGGWLQLPFALLNAANNQATYLVANSGKDLITKGRHQWYNYKFSEPVFLTDLLVDVEGYGKRGEFEFEVELEAGSVRTFSMVPQNGKRVAARINALIRSVRFRPPERTLARGKLSKVFLVGFASAELTQRLATLRDLQSVKEQIANDCQAVIEAAKAKQDQLSELESSIATATASYNDLRADLSETNNELGVQSSKRDSLATEISQKEKTLRELNSNVDDVRAKIDRSISEFERLKDQIQNKAVQLRELEKSINMFPTEISEFANQGGASARLYWLLSLIPMAVLAVMAWSLLNQAENLATVINEPEEISIASIFFTRLPFVAVATAIIITSFELAKVFVAEVMRINQQRLNLSKIAIVAKDVSEAAEVGLDTLTDEEIHDLRTRLKMHLLREHLKTYLPTDYDGGALKLPKLNKSGLLREGKGRVGSEADESEGESQALEETGDRS